MNSRLLAAVIVLCSMVALGGIASAKEKKIDRSQLPPAVEKTVAEQSQGATLKGLTVETEGGKRYYEAELIVADHHKDVTIDESGNVTEVEEEVALDNLPPAVKDALQKRAGKGTIAKVESLTKGGKLVAYEAVVKNGARRSEIQVGPNGERLAHEE